MRWEEAGEAEGHTRLLRCTPEKVAAKLRAAAEAAARDRPAGGAGSGGTQPEFRGAARGCEPQKEEEGGESGGSSVGTPSPCGSAPAAAAAAEEATEKMPALRPARLWALLALWLCRAAPARGEYRAVGLGVLPPRRRPRAAASSPAGHLGRPFGPLFARRPGSTVGSEGAHLVPESLDSVGSPPRARALPRAPRRPLPSAGGPTLLGSAGQRGSETPFLEHGVRGVGQSCPFGSAFPGVKGEPRAGCG